MTMPPILIPDTPPRTGKTIITNTTSPRILTNPPPTDPEPKSKLVILAVAALIVGWLIVFAGVFAASVPFFVCGFSTILVSNVLATLSLRE